MSLLRKHVYGPEIIRDFIIDNSDTVQIGDAVKLRNGDLEVSAADGSFSGVVIDLVDKNGNSIFGSIANVGSATVSGQPGSGSVAVASDNETVDLIRARIDMSPFTIYSATVTGTMNTTNASNKPGGWVDMDDEDSVDETTHNRTIGTGGQLKNWGVDPDDSTRMLVSINEHEFFGSNSAVAQT